ncbi:glycosyltransferase [Desulfococcaceae bacterium HSG7]|nr:glycosyltransferase [Desulfococcaceae bacterium HSG7]
MSLSIYNKVNLNEPAPLSVVIPTYKREQVLLDTIEYLTLQEPVPAEILIMDQTPKHVSVTSHKLTQYEKTGKIRWIRLSKPSIPHAMNLGLKLSKQAIVLFLDDDIVPCKTLIKSHLIAHNQDKLNIIAGRVLQPWEKTHANRNNRLFRFSSNQCQFIHEVIGCNFSVKRTLANDLGGFDENFIKVAYRFEAEFCDRALDAGNKIFFEPAASIRHLKTESGGTRIYGHHLTTLQPSHAIGAYYYILQSKRKKNRLFRIFWRPLYALKSRFYLKHPWWIPISLISELRGFYEAAKLKTKGPKYLHPL